MPCWASKNRRWVIAGSVGWSISVQAGSAVGGGEQDGARCLAERRMPAAGDPAAGAIDERGGGEILRDAGGLLSPGLAAVAGVPDDAAVADGPAGRAVDEHDVGKRGVVLHGLADGERNVAGDDRGLLGAGHRRQANDGRGEVSKSANAASVHRQESFRGCDRGVRPSGDSNGFRAIDLRRRGPAMTALRIVLASGSRRAVS